mmetsp:Transcript_3812/g.9428  ORF Transcript_3812/g.9428 Transcript_3812/m.9428 type:complete len:204 (-) Transcript_3812:655-1266(-)
MSGDRFLLTQPDTSVLDWGEHSCRDLLVVHGLSTGSENSARKENASLDRNGGELWVPMKDIADRKDVVNIALLRQSDTLACPDDLLGRRVCQDPSIPHSTLLSERVPSDCEHNCVELVRFQCVSTLRRFPVNPDLPGFSPLQLFRNASTNELSSLFLHVSADHLCTLLIKPAQWNGAHHDGGVVLESRQEPSTFQGNIRSSYN